MKALFVLCFLLPFANCAIETSTENAPVKSEIFANMGYSCESQNPNLGVLQDGAVRNRYEHYICGQATCRNGLIYYETCGTIAKENDCIKKYQHYYKPYPECCTPVTCD